MNRLDLFSNLKKKELKSRLFIASIVFLLILAI